MDSNASNEDTNNEDTNQEEETDGSVVMYVFRVAVVFIVSGLQLVLACTVCT